MKTSNFPARLFVTLGLFIISSFLLVGYTKNDETIEVLSPTEIFKSSSHIPLEILYFESRDANEIGNFYLAELKMVTKSDGTIAFKDLQTGDRLSQQLAVSLQGNRIEGGSPSNAEFNDFVFQNYSKWCGKWRNGLRGQWRMCTGADCGEGLAICFQRRI